jgi:hypothetical protein
VPQGLTFDEITPRSVKTDSSGKFDFRGGFQSGPYKLYSGKDEDGFANPFDRFYANANAEAPKVDLTEEHPSATVTVKLGERAGVIAGRVIDAESGRTLRAMLALLDGEGNGHSAVADGAYRVLVPAGKDLTIMVTLLDTSYDRWQRPVAPLRLEPGQYVFLDIPVSGR